MTLRKVKIVGVSDQLAKTGKSICTICYIDTNVYNHALCKDPNVQVGEIWYEQYKSKGWSILEHRVDIPDKTFSYLASMRYHEIIGMKNIVFEFKDYPGDLYTNPVRSTCVGMNTKLKHKHDMDGTEEVIVWKLDNNS